MMPQKEEVREKRGEATDEHATILPFTPVVELEHLLKVAASVNRDANKVWADIWGEFTHITTPGGMIHAEAKDGVVPKCGWPEFLEKLWLLKHCLDCAQRLCVKKHQGAGTSGVIGRA